MYLMGTPWAKCEKLKNNILTTVLDLVHLSFFSLKYAFHSFRVLPIIIYFRLDVFIWFNFSIQLFLNPFRRNESIRIYCSNIRSKGLEKESSRIELLAKLEIGAISPKTKEQHLEKRLPMRLAPQDFFVKTIILNSDAPA